jgi:hypothetical protein
MDCSSEWVQPYKQTNIKQRVAFIIYSFYLTACKYFDISSVYIRLQCQCLYELHKIVPIIRYIQNSLKAKIIFKKTVYQKNILYSL